jgi:uncharacterized protein (UPF0303 family)
MTGYIDVTVAIEQAKELLDEKDVLLQRIDIVRTDLRHAAVMGGATAEQKAWIAEKFPTVKRERKTDAQKAADLEKKAAELRKQPAKTAA